MERCECDHVYQRNQPHEPAPNKACKLRFSLTCGCWRRLGKRGGQHNSQRGQKRAHGLELSAVEAIVASHAAAERRNHRIGS